MKKKRDRRKAAAREEAAPAAPAPSPSASPPPQMSPSSAAMAAAYAAAVSHAAAASAAAAAAEAEMAAAHMAGLMAAAHATALVDARAAAPSPAPSPSRPSARPASAGSLPARFPSPPPSATSSAAGRAVAATSLPSPCVWVGNVPPETTEAELRSLFSPYGAVSSLRVFPASRCAFVTLASARAAVASTELEGARLGDMRLTLRVGAASRHLWVGNVPDTVDEAALSAAFSRFGRLDSVALLRRKRCAFVSFRTDVEALRAAEGASGLVMADGQPPLVVNFRKGKKGGGGGVGGGGGGGSCATRSVFDGSEPSYTPRRAPPSPALSSASGRRRVRRGGTRRGSRAVGMERPELSVDVPGESDSDASSCMSGRQSPSVASVASANSAASSTSSFRSGLDPSRQLYVGSVNRQVGEDSLRLLFEPFGVVEKVKMVAERGHAFVVFHRLSDAVAAFKHMAQAPPRVAGRQLKVKFGKQVGGQASSSSSRPGSGRATPKLGVQPLIRSSSMGSFGSSRAPRRGSLPRSSGGSFGKSTAHLASPVARLPTATLVAGKGRLFTMQVPAHTRSGSSSALLVGGTGLRSPRGSPPASDRHVPQQQQQQQQQRQRGSSGGGGGGKKSALDAVQDMYSMLPGGGAHTASTVSVASLSRTSTNRSGHSSGSDGRGVGERVGVSMARLRARYRANRQVTYSTFSQAFLKKPAVSPGDMAVSSVSRAHSAARARARARASRRVIASG